MKVPHHTEMRGLGVGLFGYYYFLGWDEFMPAECGVESGILDTRAAERGTQTNCLSIYTSAGVSFEG